MTIIVECDCGRKLRAPDQMAGRVVNCVCGKTVTLTLEVKRQQFGEVEPEFEEPDEDAEPAPVVMKPRTVSKKGPKKSHFRPAQGRNVERGDSDKEPLVPAASTFIKKKRRRDKPLATDRKRQTLEGFIPGLIRSLKFPFRTESMMTIAFMAIAYGGFTSISGFVLFGAMNIRMMAIMLLATILILGYFSFFLLQIFRLATVDEDDMPITMEFEVGQILFDLWTWMGSIWWSGAPLAVYWLVMSRLTRWGYFETFEWIPLTIAPGLIFCLALFPMALMSSALHTTVLAANPWTVIRSIFRVPLEYIATLSVFGCLCITAAVIGVVLPPYPTAIPILTQIIAWIILFYALTASAYGLGNFYYRNRHKIGWFGELPRQI